MDYFNKIFKKPRKESTLKEENRHLKAKWDLVKENMIQTQTMAKTGSWTYHVQKAEMFWSEGMESILEEAQMDLQQEEKGLLPYVHPEDLEMVKQALEKLFAGIEYNLAYRVITPSGNIKYIEEKTSVLHDENSGITKLFGVINDVTDQKIIQRNLKVFGDDLSIAQRIAGIGSWKYNFQKEKLYCTEELYKILTIEPSMLQDNLKEALGLIHPQDRKTYEEFLQNLMSGQASIAEFRILQKDGSFKYIVSKGEPVYVDEELAELFGTSQDMTNEKLLEKELREMQEKYQILIQESSEIFEILLPDGTIKYISENSKDMPIYQSQERVGEKIFDAFQGEAQEKVKSLIEEVLLEPGKRSQGIVQYLTQDKETIYAEIEMHNLLHEPAIDGIAVKIRDISERRKAEKELEYLSTHDVLTGLPNRIYCERNLKILGEEAKRDDKKFALIVADIDGVKYVNYSLGYDLGDQLILKIVERLKENLGDNTTLSRHMDDHFVICAKDINTLEECEAEAENILRLFKNPFLVENYELDISVNLGIAMFPKDAKDVLSLKNNAKAALMRAKKEGKNTYQIYASKMDIQSYKEFILRSDLHKAIENNQLSIHYKPIVNIRTNQILAAEAKVIWNHPEWGTVAPYEFIHLAEETGKIIDIGKWALQEICKDYSQWQTKKWPKIKILLPFSGVQFLENDFVEHFHRFLKAYKLESRFLIMEIDEDIFKNDTEKISTDLQKIREIGVEIAIKNFGTGFLSLQTLNTLNIDILKIDNSATKKIPQDQVNTTITKAVIELARELKIKLLADGIENFKQLNFFAQHHCYAGAGFIYSKAVPKHEFEKLLVQKTLKPSAPDGGYKIQVEERRKVFRVIMPHLLETDVTVLELKGKKTNVGSTKALIKDMGPGGLGFISDIKFPVNKAITLQFTTHLLNEKLVLNGSTVWTNEINSRIFEYGIQFNMDENDRRKLTKILNSLQIKSKTQPNAIDGDFVTSTSEEYFHKKANNP